MDFFGAEYALAPRLLIAANHAERPEWVLGNFSRPLDYKQIGEVQDFGHGVVLFKRKER